MKIQRAIVTALIATLVTSSAWACGDSMHRVGKGGSYRTYSAPLPGNLLFLGSSASTRQLAEQLAMSGHEVRLVRSVAELIEELEKGGYDVVIAPFGEKVAIAAASTVEFLPIAATRDEAKQARQSYDRVMVAGKHKIKHYLKSIHIALKSNA